MNIYIVRHAEPDYSIDSLTEKGWREAALLGKRLEKITPAYYYVSPLGRAKDTASFTLRAAGASAEEMDWLREFDHGYRVMQRGHASGLAWDVLPADWAQEPVYYDPERWSDGPLYRDTTGQELSRFYRPPQGKYSKENLKMAHNLGYTTVFWSLAYVDWYADKQPTAEQAYAKLLPRIHNGAIVLLHSTSSTNAAILDELLTRWEDMGYTFASLTELQPANGKI